MLESEEPSEPTPTATETSIPIAPTIGGDTDTDEPAATSTPEGEATAEEGGAPTAIPEPTQIPTEGEGSETTPVVPEAGPGISINPQLSEPGTTITVDGDGFGAGQTVPLAWADSALGDGDQFDTVLADDEGAFTTTVTVPASSEWPGGSAEENEAIYLQAIDTSDNIVYWAEFKYIELFNPQEPVLNFDNPDEGYSISVPNGWAWTWTEEETDNVRFQAPTETGGGFIRAFNSTSVESVIQTVMNSEFPDQSYTTAGAAAGRYAGQQAVTENDDTVYFFPNPGEGRVYALYFVDSGDNIPFQVIDTFTFLQQ
jgi:hypothetical protein